MDNGAIDPGLADLLLRMQEGDPEALQALIDATLSEDRAGLAGQQMKMGQGLMQTPGAEERSVGGTYVAASPLEHLSTAMSRAMGAQMTRGAQADANDQIGKKGAGLLTFLQGLARPRTPQDPVPASPWQPPNFLP